MMTPLRIKNVVRAAILLHAFLRHLGPLRASLAGFETRVDLVDHVECAFTLHDLASCVTTFGGSE